MSVTSDYDVQRGTFAYISCYLEDNGVTWSTSNMPRCADDTFTFDSRNVNRPEDPLVVFNSWGYQFAQPIAAQLLAIDYARAEQMKKYVLALQTKRDTIVSTNQTRALLSLPAMSIEEVVALLD